MFLNYYVNPSMETLQTSACSNFTLDPSGCSICDINNGANFTSLPNDFGRRVDIEGQLRGINKATSLCSSNKFGGCLNEKDSSDCNNFVSVTPRLCDRSIIPSNMKTTY